ncbi:FtsQ-type POTRA domain-containing protein [Agromyces albus]|uniref:FtsQ-type POTRA domain-containing protein n=1 Tax=Agromyces albus TaxID=205332 RepID=UPI002785336F|nr:FtsQ-type POTRA domain-containing protein [Agromyces albus]MDQ0575132.1 cell division protein FtsQ [Agromyces albus]
MKRPQGFDQPAKRRAGRPKPAGAAPAARESAATATTAGAPRRTAGSKPPSDRDRVATEPIPVVAASGSTLSHTPDAEPGRPASASGLAVPGDLPRDARSTRRALAAAARERRRYERQEVRRFTKRSRRRRLVWSVVLGSIAALVVVVIGGAYSPLMALRDVRVEGAQRIPATEVQAAFAGTLGTPLPLIASADVHDALSAFPLIETYSTETIPPGTLVVRIVERTPVGVIDTGEGLELVDAAGVVIERPETRPDGQPLIEAEGGIAGEGFRAAAAVVRSLPPDVRGQLVGVHAATADDVRLQLAAGATVVWGSAEESAQKAAVLARLMVAAPPDTVASYDVSSPQSAVTR